MAKDELIDIYLPPYGPAAPSPSGRVETRAKAHRDGLWHGSFLCWVLRWHEGRWQVLLQYRRHEAEMFAGLLDFSAAGHLAAGESPLDAARELAEELGPGAPAASALSPLGHLVLDVAVPGVGRNCECCFVYVGIGEWEVMELGGGPQEIGGLVVADLAELLDLAEDRKGSLAIRGYLYDHQGGKLEVTHRVSRKSFVLGLNPVMREGLHRAAAALPERPSR